MGRPSTATVSASLAPAVAEVPAPLPAQGATFVWEHPAAGTRAVAFGEAARATGGGLRALLGSLAPAGDALPLGPWFGASAFDAARPMWDGFAPGAFVLPALLSLSAGGRHFLAAFGDDAVARLEQARRGLEQAAPAAMPNAVRRLDPPDARAAWARLVQDALQQIARGTLDKVVVARPIDVEADGEFDATAVVEALARRFPGCRAFLVRGADGAFVGATPELLCRIDGARLETEALAGSASPAAAESLLQSAKDAREHAWVVEHLRAALTPLTRELRIGAPELRRLPNVAHLRTPVHATLAPGRDVADVAAALHPTPAVCGVPQTAALRFLAEHEGFDRGLYAGAVGWVGPGRAELCVALRAALVRGRRARLFVGAGIVAGSDPEAEFAETELKARALLDALGARP